MLFTKIKKNRGFTIVETLIVLAIAALILIIVLIAVPDLQRSARNSNMKTDADNVASAIQTYEGNNQGTIPNHVTQSTTNPGTWTVCEVSTPGGGGSCNGVSATFHVQPADTVSVATSGTVSAYTATTQSHIYLYSGYDCPASGLGNTGNVTLTQNSRAVAIIYPVDSGSAWASECNQE